MAENSSNFKESIRLLFLRYTFMPIIVLFVFFLLFTGFNAKIIVANKSQEANKVISASLSGVYFNYYDEINRMAALPLVSDFAATRLESQNVYEEFYEFNTHQTVKSVFYIIDTKGIYLASTAPSDSDIQETIYRTIVPRIAKAPESTLVEANKIRYSHDRYTVYTFGKAIIKDNQVIGYILYQLYEEDFQKLIFVQNNEISVITDRHHTIIATTNNITKGLMNKFAPIFNSKGNVQLNGGSYYMSQASIPLTEINVFTLNSSQLQRYVYVSLIVFIVVTSLLLWFLIQFLANKMSTRNTQSIDKLLFAVNQLQQGNTLSYVDIHTGDEFETLADQYNIMLTRLNELLHKNEELSNLRRLIEVKHLQSQFHPHFIFNVLETLRYAIVVDSKQAQDIVMILSRLLRYSISNDGQTVLLSDDLNHTTDYLRLQQIRFNERLSYDMQLSEQSRHALVPKLLLQAIIENSIRYGYLHQESLLISIRGYLDETDLILEVEDDGSGMSEERLEQIRQLLNDPDIPTKHIGLSNVHRRLLLLYGPGYGIQLLSRLGEGTCVTIRLPYEKGDVHV
ncbi:sensor histidine kinase [Paenibacillus luteus]|uniref:sensor histidine kinase n=1 Tax=Paenibacillus luteus TaxID=2545753 RepID=UPI001143FDA1|nr:histidine kinase [Paenibacillus luteus]